MAIKTKAQLKAYFETNDIPTEGQFADLIDSFKNAMANISTVNSATYDILITDEILHVTYTTTGAVTIDFKTAQFVTGRTIVIKDAGGNAGTNNITLTTEGAQTIDGSATAVINSNYSAINVYCDGSNLFIY